MADARNFYHPHRTLDEPLWISSAPSSSTSIADALAWAVATGIVLALLLSISL